MKMLGEFSVLSAIRLNCHHYVGDKKIKEEARVWYFEFLQYDVAG